MFDMTVLLLAITLLVVLALVLYIFKLYRSRQFVIDQGVKLYKELRDTKDERDVLYKKLPSVSVPIEHGWYVVQQPSQLVIGRCLEYGNGWTIFNKDTKEKFAKRDFECQATLHQWSFKPIHLVRTSPQESGDYRYVSKDDCYDHTDGLITILRSILLQIDRDKRKQIALATTEGCIWETMQLILWDGGILSEFAIECMCQTTFFTDDFIDPIIDRLLYTKDVIAINHACRLLEQYPHKAHLYLLTELLEGDYHTSIIDRINSTIEMLQRQNP